MSTEQELKQPHQPTEGTQANLVPDKEAQVPKAEEKEEHVDKKEYYSAIAKTVYLSCSFCLLFTAFNSAQNMVSQVYANLGYNDLGNIALFTIYFVFATSCLFGSKMVQLASPKVIFFISGFCYNTFIFAGFVAVHCPESNDGDLPTECKQGVLYSYIIFTSLLLGIAASTIWVNTIYNYYFILFLFFLRF